MTARQVSLGALLTAAAFAVLAYNTSWLMYADGELAAAQAQRSFLIILTSLLIGWGVRRLSHTPVWAVVLAWYVGSQFGAAIASRSLSPSLLSLGLVPPAGHAFSLSSSLWAFAAYLPSVLALLIGGFIGERNRRRAAGRTAVSAG